MNVEKPVGNCQNCNHKLHGSYCANCGQRHLIEGIKLKQLWEEFSSYFLGLESPLVETFRGLTVNPGKVSREFFSGKRKKYYRPIQYFILAIAFYYLVRAGLGFDPVDHALEDTNGIGREISPIMMKSNKWMSRNVNLVIPIWIVLLATFDRLFFRKDQFNFTERFIHYTFSVAHYIVLSTILIPLLHFKILPSYAMYPLVYIFISFSVVTLHTGGMFGRLMRSISMTLISFVLYAGISTGLIYFFIKTFPG